MKKRYGGRERINNDQTWNTLQRLGQVEERYHGWPMLQREAKCLATKWVKIRQYMDLPTFKVHQTSKYFLG